MLSQVRMEFGQGTHQYLVVLACCGLLAWSVGFLVVIFVRMYGRRDRFRPEVMLHYGYFFVGLEPKYWWWDILVKRMDLLLLMGVTYTNVIESARAST